MFLVTCNDALQSKPAKYAQLCLTPDDNMYYIRAMPDRKTLISRYCNTKSTQGEIFTTCENWGQKPGSVLPLSQKAKSSSEKSKKQTFFSLQSKMMELVAPLSVKGSLTCNEWVFLLFNVTLMHFRFKIILIPKAFKNIICLDSLCLSVGKPRPDLILYCGINKTISPGIKSSLIRIKTSTSPNESQAFKTVHVCMCWPFSFQ